MKTILIVEDEFAPAEGLLHLLIEEGYRAVVARDGREGLRRLAEEHPDLLLVDYMMPEMNGADMIREVRKDPAYEKTPIILMSAAHEAILRRYYAGYDAYVKKPFDTAQLLELIRRMLPES